MEIESGFLQAYSFITQCIIAIIQQCFSEKTEITILETGCGKGDFLLALNKYLQEYFPSIQFKIYGFDVHERPQHHMIDASKIKLINEDEIWPYTDNFFDIIFSIQVLEHVKNADFFFSQLNRVLANGGYSIHHYPVKEIIVEPHYKIPFVHWIDNWDFRKFLIKKFSRAGFGTYKKQVKEEVDESLEKWAVQHSDYTTNFTHYLKLNDYLALTKRLGFRASFRLTHDYYSHRTLQKFGLKKDLKLKIEKEFSFSKDYVLLNLYKRLASVNLMLHKLNTI